MKNNTEKDTLQTDQEEPVVLPEPNQTERVTKGGWEGDLYN